MRSARIALSQDILQKTASNLATRPLSYAAIAMRPGILQRSVQSPKTGAKSFALTASNVRHLPHPPDRLANIDLAGHGKGRCKEPILEDRTAGETGMTDVGTTDALAPTSGEGWGSAAADGSAAQDTLISTADTWGATDAPESTPNTDGWNTKANPSDNGW